MIEKILKLEVSIFKKPFTATKEYIQEKNTLLSIVLILINLGLLTLFIFFLTKEQIIDIYYWMAGNTESIARNVKSFSLPTVFLFIGINICFYSLIFYVGLISFPKFLLKLKPKYHQVINLIGINSLISSTILIINIAIFQVLPLLSLLLFFLFHLLYLLNLFLGYVMALQEKNKSVYIFSLSLFFPLLLFILINTLRIYL